MRLELEKLSGWVNPADAFVSLHAADDNAFWLDRSANPDEAISVIGSSGRVHALGTEAFDFAKQYLENLHSRISHYPNKEIPFSFRPGLVGYLGYELTLEQGEWDQPRSQLMEVDRAMVFDHKNREMYFIGLFQSHQEFIDWHRAAFLRLTLLGGEAAAYIQKTKQPRILSMSLARQPQQYLEQIKKCKEYIASGDVYQLCLTNQISIEHQADPLRTFLDLRNSNPAPYGSFLKIGELEIVSSSPEQFLKTSSSGEVSTKPIKGTRPRSSDAKQDQAIAQELLENEKERAENLMIVDLMRNDLARVCVPQSVSVSKLFEVQSYSTLHQLVSTITGTLQSGNGAIDAIRALFPAGSMTGAPKLRAIEILSELEAAPRGIYSGAIGFLGLNGTAEFGMTIRTLVFDKNQITIGIGGGITSDSDPESELAETMLKAKALLNALGGADWKI